MTKIALVAIDLDGTMLTAEGELAPRSAEQVRAASQRGCTVVLASTRNPESIARYSLALDLDDPIIGTNGAQIWASPSGPIWARYTIPLEVAQAIAELADRQGWELGITVGDTTYYRQRPGQNVGPLAPGRAVVAKNADALHDAPVRILTWTPEAIPRIQRLCHDQFPDAVRLQIHHEPDGSVRSLGVFPAGVNKGNALALVMEQLDVDADQVLAIGDDLNDMPMFEQAGFSVALAHAPEAAQAAADRVAPPGEEGVAWALKAFEIA